MVIIRSGWLPAGAATGPEASGAPGDGPLRVRAAEEFAGEVATGRVPSVRMIRARLHVGQVRAQRGRAYLAALSNRKSTATRLPTRPKAPQQRAQVTADLDGVRVCRNGQTGQS